MIQRKTKFETGLHGCINNSSNYFGGVIYSDLNNEKEERDNPYKRVTHPLSNMKIDHKWEAVIADGQKEIGEDLRKKLIQVIANNGSDIFNYPVDDPNADAIRKFEIISNELIRSFIGDADQLRIEARGFGNIQYNGNRTYPHYHHSFDGVLIYYLTAGNEYILGDNNYPIPLEQMGKKSSGESSGDLLIQDHRPSINQSFHKANDVSEKFIEFKLKTGLFVLHPAYLWHESNTYFGNGVRVGIIVNYRIMTDENQTFVKPLATL